MKKKLIVLLKFAFACAIGTVIGQSLCYFIIPTSKVETHVCTCEYCKTKRQLEAIEVVDSIIHDRIVINIENDCE